jgi:dGTPase
VQALPGYDAPDLARFVDEPPKRAGRTAFERDRARVLHSAALRRLAAKTQVVAPGSDDFVRNRLTHSLEVAQVGRELGKAFGCDPDVVDAACLAHDLGHPPFGHNGEVALDELAADCGGFEGNAQTLRLLTRLEPKVLTPDGSSAGLNLTRATLDAATKYPWPRGAGPGGPDASVKFGVYPDDLPVFAWVRDGAPTRRRCLEAQVMDLADDIAYSVHDVEDAIVAGRLDLSAIDDASTRAGVVDLVRDWYAADLPRAVLSAALDRLRALPTWVRGYDGSRRAQAALKNLTSQLIGRWCLTVEDATLAAHPSWPLTRYSAQLVVADDVRAEIVTMKGIAARFVMTAADRQPEYARQRDLLAELVTALLDRAPDVLDRDLAADWAIAADDAARRRVVLDQVAVLTDASAVAWHRRLAAG